MTTHEVARWFDGLRTWLGDALNKTTAKGLTEVSDAFRELPDKPFKDFVKDIKSAGGGASALFEEIKAYRNSQAGSAEQLRARVSKLKLAEAKEITRGLGLPARKKLDDFKSQLREYIDGTIGPSPTTNGVAGSTSSISQEIDTGYRQFLQLKESLGSLTIDELRARFEYFRRFSVPVLEGIAQRLGYHFTGSKDRVFGQLLQTLEGMNISQYRGEVIGSM